MGSACFLKGEGKGWVLTRFAFSSGRTPDPSFSLSTCFPMEFQRTTVVASLFERQYRMLRELTIAPVFLHPNPFCFYEIISELQKSFREKNPACPHIPSDNLGHGNTEPVSSLTPFLVVHGHKTALSSRREAALLCFHLTC